MLHSSGLGLESNYVTSWKQKCFLIMFSFLFFCYISWFSSSKSLCPPQLRVFALARRAYFVCWCVNSLLFIQSLQLLECKAFFFPPHMFICLAGFAPARNFTQLSILHHCLSVRPRVFMFTSLCCCKMYYVFLFFLCPRLHCACVCVGIREWTAGI